MEDTDDTDENPMSKWVIIGAGIVLAMILLVIIARLGKVLK